VGVQWSGSGSSRSGRYRTPPKKQQKMRLPASQPTDEFIVICSRRPTTVHNFSTNRRSAVTLILVSPPQNLHICIWGSVLWICVRIWVWIGVWVGFGSVSLWSVKRRQMVEKKETVKIKTHLRKRLWEIRCLSMENLTHIYMSTYSGFHK